MPLAKPFFPETINRFFYFTSLILPYCKWKGKEVKNYSHLFANRSSTSRDSRNTSSSRQNRYQKSLFYFQDMGTKPALPYMSYILKTSKSVPTRKYILWYNFSCAKFGPNSNLKVHMEDTTWKNELRWNLNQGAISTFFL